MALLDWFCVALLLGSLVLGAWRGFVYEVLSVLNWLLAFVLAQWFGQDVGQQLPMGGMSDVLRFAAGFLLVFVAVALVGSMLVWLMTKLVDSSGLRPMNRALGAGFGVVRGVILLLAATVVMEMTPMKTSGWWRDSKAAGVSKSALKGLKPVLPDMMGKYFP
jgi:membrane protein required for colicin V production